MGRDYKYVDMNLGFLPHLRLPPQIMGWQNRTNTPFMTMCRDPPSNWEIWKPFHALPWLPTYSFHDECSTCIVSNPIGWIFMQNVIYILAIHEYVLLNYFSKALILICKTSAQLFYSNPEKKSSPGEELHSKLDWWNPFHSKIPINLHLAI